MSETELEPANPLERECSDCHVVFPLNASNFYSPCRDHHGNRYFEGRCRTCSARIRRARANYTPVERRANACRIETPEYQQTIFALWQEGHTWKSIAQQIGISYGYLMKCKREGRLATHPIVES